MPIAGKYPNTQERVLIQWLMEGKDILSFYAGINYSDEKTEYNGDFTDLETKSLSDKP